MTYKTSLRKEKIRERNLISQNEMDQVEKKTASLFMDMFSELKIKKVSIYIPVHNEVPTKRIIQLIIGSKTECYLPVIDQDLNNKKMKFAEFNHETALVKNKFNISEPISRTFENVLQLELVVMPLVAFDNEGFRLGMGKGYYDFTFGSSEINRKPLFWGLSYDFQKTDSCYPEEHDLKMEAVICPSGVRKFT
ncbi:MAG TPA: 5-formyltetrahydrofolate cyclo-ligase [Gammaproteobacteria bacterium]|jgi:5-formyltetrahydrofolate cyclo-ligase|nr:5-formyltetrahydrofolate cyclo-ligase [Gammaproteobacteria bacterium]HIA43702.1 5-formyltetrahydrofolate cyclo-ligase [Gammaproteobacteria bacterium]HIA96193.1 5-formyltetrahydrofolate cyclo-ligase [Gammaproteobacteria bacterium]HIB75584.1 5-formyltetrahydrofolate cyclo-ligase [Gammaproteobacteria bacterium]HIG49954.1 5-formyltetrahydrofolate cyclo-ligase [Gammaproteobacteria bacterium]|tara:strand:+ start:1827 stop:2405 length:579 start_codon:yes stop_codon:yes gene_type:complete